MLTLKNFLSIIEENNDVDSAVMQIQQQIGTIEAQINQRTQNLINQKAQLQKRLLPLLKRKEQENKTTTNNQQKQNPMQAANQTTTPGGTGTNTPGNSRFG